MHKKVYLIFSFIFLSFQAIAQNLVPNSSFEEYKHCEINYPLPPTACRYNCGGYAIPKPQWGGINEITGTLYWRAVNTAGVVNYFNDCNTTHTPLSQSDLSKWYYPRTGSAFIALYTYGLLNYPGNPEEVRSYATVKLIEPLETGCRYEISFYAKLGNSPVPGPVWGNFLPSDGLAAFLSTDSLYDDQTHPASLYHITPQVDFPGQLITDSVNYVRVSKIITATGGEQYLTLGNFRDNAHTLLGKAPYDEGMGATYFIDDVSVVKLTPTIQITPSDQITICKDSTTLLSVSPGFDSYTWSTGSSSLSISTGTAGKFWVNGIFGCITSSDTVTVNVQEPFTDLFSIAGDTFLCESPELNDIYLQASSGYASYKWNTGETTAQIEIETGGTYWVEAEYACGSVSDTFDIVVYQPPSSLLLPENDTTICSGSAIVLSTVSGFTDHLWSTGSSDPIIVVNASQRYYVSANSIEGCLVKDSVEISIIYPPVVNIIGDTMGCEGVPIQLSATVIDEELFVWDNGSLSSVREVVHSGKYWIKAQNRCSITSDTIVVDFLDCKLTIPNLITPNSDSLNDSLVILSEVARSLHLEIYNRWGQKIYEEEGYKNAWGSNVDPGIYFYRLYDDLLKRHYNGWIEVI